MGDRAVAFVQKLSGMERVSRQVLLVIAELADETPEIPGEPIIFHASLAAADLAVVETRCGLASAQLDHVLRILPGITPTLHVTEYADPEPGGSFTVLFGHGFVPGVPTRRLEPMPEPSQNPDPTGGVRGRLGTCQRCGLRVEWFPTRGGKRVPLELCLFADQQVPAERRWWVTRGTARPAVGKRGHCRVTHFVVCPMAPEPADAAVLRDAWQANDAAWHANNQARWGASHDDDDGGQEYVDGRLVP